MSRAPTDSVPNLPDLTGVWACLQVTTGEVRVVRIGRFETVTRLTSRLELSQQDREVSVVWTVLRLDIDSGTRLARPRLSRRVVDAMEVLQRPGRIEGDAASGFRLVLPLVSSTLGAVLRDPDEPLPKRRADPRVVDAEGNGRPGATIEFGGLVRGLVDVVQRSRSRLEGRILGPDYVEGRVRWRVEQKVLGATNPLLRLAPLTRPLDDPERSWFRMTRVRGEAGRDELLEAARGLSDDGDRRQEEE